MTPIPNGLPIVTGSLSSPSARRPPKNPTAPIPIPTATLSTRDRAKDKDGDTSQIYLISPTGGEAFPITTGDEDVHDFSWSADSHTIYFATRNPWTKAQKDDYKKAWKDVVQYRNAERGDTIYALDLAAAIERHTAAPAKVDSDAEKDSIGTPGARAIATSPLRVDDLVTSPDGGKLAFASNAINQRQEKVEDVEIYVIDSGEFFACHCSARSHP